MKWSANDSSSIWCTTWMSLATRHPVVVLGHAADGDALARARKRRAVVHRSAHLQPGPGLPVAGTLQPATLPVVTGVRRGVELGRVEEPELGHLPADRGGSTTSSVSATQVAVLVRHVGRDGDVDHRASGGPVVHPCPCLTVRPGSSTTTWRRVHDPEPVTHAETVSASTVAYPRAARGGRRAGRRRRRDVVGVGDPCASSRRARGRADVREAPGPGRRSPGQSGKADRAGLVSGAVGQLREEAEQPGQRRAVCR